MPCGTGETEAERGDEERKPEGIGGGSSRGEDKEHSAAIGALK